MADLGTQKLPPVAGTLTEAEDFTATASGVALGTGIALDCTTW